MRTLEEVDKARKVREVFRTVLDPRKPDTAVVVGAILDQAGYFSMNSDTVKPELVALCNWLLGQLGIVTPSNVFAYTQAILGTASDEDLIAERKMILEGGSDE